MSGWLSALHGSLRFVTPARQRAGEDTAPLAITAFAGIRGAEIARLDWSAVDLDRRIIEVRAGQAKTASRRSGGMGFMGLY